MISKQTTVNQIEITQNGTVQVRVGLELVENGNVLTQRWHRTLFPPACDIDAQFALVNTHLIQQGENPVTQIDIDKVRAHCSTAWTPQVLAAYAASQNQV